MGARGGGGGGEKRGFHPVRHVARRQVCSHAGELFTSD